MAARRTSKSEMKPSQGVGVWPLYTSNLWNTLSLHSKQYDSISRQEQVYKYQSETLLRDLLISAERELTKGLEMSRAFWRTGECMRRIHLRTRPRLFGKHPTQSSYLNGNAKRRLEKRVISLLEWETSAPYWKLVTVFKGRAIETTSRPELGDQVAFPFCVSSCVCVVYSACDCVSCVATHL